MSIVHRALCTVVRAATKRSVAQVGVQVCGQCLQEANQALTLLLGGAAQSKELEPRRENMLHTQVQQMQDNARDACLQASGVVWSY